MMFPVSVAIAHDYYVDANSGSDDPGAGTEGNPFKTITYALNYATSSGDYVYIAAGAYDTALGESFPLGMNSNVSLLGESPDNVTVDAGESAKHVISCISDGAPTISGMTIKGGKAGASTPFTADAYGGGILIWNCSPTIENCIITGNEALGEYAGAAGIACIGVLFGTSLPVIRDCVISHNTVKTTGTADGAGGGIGCLAVYFGTCNVVIEDCAIAGNFAEAQDAGGSVAGGGIGCAIADDTDSCIVEITNCLVIDNGLSAPVYAHGGGIYGHLSDLTMTNCTVANNSPDGVNVSGHTSTLRSSIIWDNGDDIADMDCSEISYCDISDGTCSGQNNNISVDPKFVSRGYGGVRYDTYFLRYETEDDKSPCIDAGDTSQNPYGGAGNTAYSTDVNGYLDMTDGDDVDMGYHYQYESNTYIELASFEARSGIGTIILCWETGAEIDNEGFVLFRSMSRDGGFEAISDLIQANGTPASGSRYIFHDRHVRPGVEYTYYLVDIDTSGTWTAHGPASARCGLVPEMNLNGAFWAVNQTKELMLSIIQN